MPHRLEVTNVERPQPVVVTIASLNLAGRPDIGDILSTWARDRSIDVLLLQEVGHRSLDGEALVSSVATQLNFHAAYAPADLLEDGRTQGLAILSRFSLEQGSVQRLRRHRLRFKSRCRIALAVTVAEHDGSIRLVNVHLDTRINTSDRIAQLTPVVDELSRADGPQIIGGDFNTMDVGWLRTMWPIPFVQRQSSAVRALLEKGGFQTPFLNTPPTFRAVGIPLRLDWLYLKHLAPVEWGVDFVRATDHRGVWLRIATGSREGEVPTGSTSRRAAPSGSQNPVYAPTDRSH
jgi:endonuclease/exonuclease/phosphatase family metal-dependent hydrolase